MYFSLANNLMISFKSIGGIILAIVILLAMVTIHEFGHYLAGKKLGFKINEFSVGFGPAIFKHRSKKTGELFAVRIVPLGGYCAFDGEDDYGETEEVKDKTEIAETEETTKTVEKTETVEEVKEDEYPTPKGERFNDMPPWKRIIVLVAGATMNYLLALVLIIIMFSCYGQPMYQVMVKPEQSTSQTSAYLVEEDLYESPLKAGDVIETVDGKRMYLLTDYIDALKNKKQGDVIKFGITRTTDGEKQKMTVEVIAQKDAEFKNSSNTVEILNVAGIWGLSPVNVRYGFKTVGYSFRYSTKIGVAILRSFGELLTGKMAITSMGGPVTTIKVASQEASAGFMRFLNIAGFIGVNLAVFNLLPIPALDGSKVVFCIIEWIRKKPLNRKVETIIHLVGIIVLFAFAILVDVLQFLH